MLLEVLLSFLRSWNRYTEYIVSFVHAALGSLFLVVFYVCLTVLGDPLLNPELNLCSTILLLIFLV